MLGRGACQRKGVFSSRFFVYTSTGIAPMTKNTRLSLREGDIIKEPFRKIGFILVHNAVVISM
jgi:hypothetical protein